MIEAGLAVIFVIAALGLLLFLWGKKKRVSLTRVSLPFAEFSVSSFDGLPAVMMFSQLSMACIPTDSSMSNSIDDGATANSTPTMMIHTGWNLVCDAFIRQFGAYPNDDEILKAAASLGGQNVEFVQMFRGIYNASIQHANEVDREFAANYLVRAPSLAERIYSDARSNAPRDEEFLSLMVSAETIVSRFDHKPRADPQPAEATAEEIGLALTAPQRQKLTEVATDEDWAAPWDSVAADLEVKGLVRRQAMNDDKVLALMTEQGFKVYSAIQNGQ